MPLPVGILWKSADRNARTGRFLKTLLKHDEETIMGRSVLAVALVGLVLATSGCSTEEAEAPTFQMTSPESATSTTAAPNRLAWVGNPELTAAEIELCRFVERVDSQLERVDTTNRRNTEQVGQASKDRTLSEPIRVRMIRDAELDNAQRFANVLGMFEEGGVLLASVLPNERVSAEHLASNVDDVALIAGIGAALNETIAGLRPLTAAEQEEYASTTGLEWRDLFTEDELEVAREQLNSDRAGMGREEEARQAMDRVDDWSWRHCSEGFSD